jgi:hypothetical protein
VRFSEDEDMPHKLDSDREEDEDKDGEEDNIL